MPDYYSGRNKLVIRLLLGAAFLVILNETLMSIAIRELMVDLNITARAAQWLTTAVMLTMAVVIPITGFLLQRFNTRPIFTTAMTLFSTGTLIAAVAPGFDVLLMGRIVQALGAAVMVPLLMTTMMTLVPANERGKAMGNISIVVTMAPAIGPTISGVILSTLSWRWIFLLVLPIAVTMLVIGYRRIENVTEPKKVPIDVVSVMLSVFGFGGLLYGLSQVGADSGPAETSAPMWIALAVGAVALVSFLLRQRLPQVDWGQVVRSGAPGLSGPPWPWPPPVRRCPRRAVPWATGPARGVNGRFRPPHPRAPGPRTAGHDAHGVPARPGANHVAVAERTPPFGCGLGWPPSWPLLHPSRPTSRTYAGNGRLLPSDSASTDTRQSPQRRPRIGVSTRQDGHP